MAADRYSGLAGAALASVFGAVSRARGRRSFHPHGVGFRATLEPFGEPSGATALDRAGEATVRLSRSLGLPEWTLDPCGLALRLPDAHGPDRHQDLLLVSSGRRRGWRHALLPSRGFGDRPYSSLLPYRLRGDLVVVGARALAPGPGPLLADLRAAPPALGFELGLARPGGEWRPVAVLSLQDRVSDDEIERLALNPVNTGGGLELAGFLNRMRGPSYRGSQGGRDAELPPPQTRRRAPWRSRRSRRARRR
jgi:hypothetical protein